MLRRRVTARLVALALCALGLGLLLGSGDGEERGPAPAPEPGAQGTAEPSPSRETGSAITRRGIAEHLDALQSVADEHDGTRAAGTDGGKATVDLLVAELERAGWTVETPSFALPVFAELPGSPRLTAGGDRVPRAQVRTLAYSGDGTATGRVRPLDLDLGESSDSGCRQRDFAALRDGEIALVQRGTCLLRDKARNAQRAGAAGVVIVNDGTAGNTQAFSGTLVRPGLRIPAVVVATRAAARLAGRRATLTVDAVSERADLRNVVAESPGAEDAERVVMAGGHLDSVPRGPGINDNGSGIAALLEMAEALGDEPVRLGFWNAEELGLHGSRRYVRSLDRAGRRRIAAYVNLDMVGTPDGEARPRAYGDPSVLEALQGAARRDLPRTSLGKSSDHAPFDAAGVAVGGLYTGLHDCYHRACDDAGAVDRALATRMARVAARAVRALASEAG